MSRHPPIDDWQLERSGEVLFLGLSIGFAIVEIVTDLTTLRVCVDLLATRERGLRDVQIGRFGDYVVTLNNHNDDTVSIFIDGPWFSPTRSQSAAIWVDKASLYQVLQKVCAGEEPPAPPGRG